MQGASEEDSASSFAEPASSSASGRAAAFSSSAGPSAGVGGVRCRTPTLSFPTQLLRLELRVKVFECTPVREITAASLNLAEASEALMRPGGLDCGRRT